MTDEQKRRIDEKVAETLRRRQQHAEHRRRLAEARTVGLRARHDAKLRRRQ